MLFCVGIAKRFERRDTAVPEMYVAVGMVVFCVGSTISYLTSCG